MAATLPELEYALVQADQAGDVNTARSLAAAVSHMRENKQQLYEPPAPRPTLLQRAGDVVTGNLRKTKTSEALPDWAGMPELNDLSIAGAKTAVGTMLSNPAETAQIIKANYPEAKVRQDEKGNWLITSSVDGKEYAIKPGFRVSDIPRALGALLAFSPAGAAKSAVGMGVKSAATQAGIEGSQAATGGEFNPAEVAIAGGVGAVLPPVVNAVKAIAAPAKTMLDDLLGRGTPKGPIPGATPPSAASPGVAPPVAPSPAPAAPVTPPAAPVAPAPVAPMPAPALAQTAKTAAEGGLGSKQAVQTLAAQAAPDAKTVEAAKRLGIENYLQPDHVTTNQAYRELAQAVKSVPGSLSRTQEIEGLNAIGKRADDLITEIGGSTDASQVSASVKANMQRTQADLDSQAEKLYGELRKTIPPKAEAPAPNVLGFITQRADELGGTTNLTSMEKSILAKLSPKQTKGEIAVPASGEMSAADFVKQQAAAAQGTVKQPTYALLDDVRRDLTAAKYKRQGTFKDADTGLIKKLEMELKKDQRAAIEPYGMLDTFDIAQSAVRVRKGIEDDLTALYGATLDGSIVGDLSAAVKQVGSGDTTRLVKLLKSTPETMRQELMATGLNTAFGKQVQNGALNFNTYARWYGGLLENKQAYAAVMSNLPPGARKQLSDLYRVAKGVSMATRERITTGRIQAVQDELKGVDTFMGSLYGLAKRSGVGLAAEAVTTPLGVPGAGLAAGLASALTKGKPNALKAVDVLVASPEFASAISKASAGQTKQAAVRLAYSKPFNKFVRAVGNPKELSNRERWILQTLEAQNQGN